MTLLKEIVMEKGYEISQLVGIKDFELKTSQKKTKYASFTAFDKSGARLCLYFTSYDNDDAMRAEDFYEKFKDIKVGFLQAVVDTYENKKTGEMASSIKVKTLAEPEEEEGLKFLEENKMPEETSKSASATSKVEIPDFSTLNFKEHLSKQAALKTLKEAGQKISHILRISNVEIKDAKNNTQFALFKLSDSTLEVGAKQWKIGGKEAFLNKFKDVSAVYVVGETDVYQDKLQIVAEALEPLSKLGEQDLESLYVSSVYGSLFLKREIWKFVQTIENPWIKKICQEFLLDPKLKNFGLVPAGIGKHHNVRFGLCEHVYRLLLLITDFCDSYNKHMYPENKVRLNKDLLIAGAILHDFFKCEEYNPDITYNVNGNLMGHISRGILEIGCKTAKIPEFPDEIKLQLAAMVSSHHGQISWGSPDAMVMPESLVLHHFDNLASKLDPVVIALNNLSENENWTDKLKSIEKPAYRGGALLTKFNNDMIQGT